MTLHDVVRLNRYWQKNPPLIVLVRSIAHALGIEIKEAETPHYVTPEEARRMLAATGGAIDGVGSL